MNYGEKLGRFELVRPNEENGQLSYKCWCCRDTGFVTWSDELRDETTLEGKLQPPLVCKNCDGIYNLFAGSTILDFETKTARFATDAEIEQVINERFDNRATAEQCRKMHEFAKEDAKTIGKRLPTEVSAAMDELFEGTEF